MSTGSPLRIVCDLSNPSRSNPNFFTNPNSAWLSEKAVAMILRVSPSAKISANASRSASAVVSRPQNVRLKMQCQSAHTGLIRVEITAPPSTPSLHTPQLQRPAASAASH
jgi:hypothetical protein